jgi:hypothetical protein
VRLPWLLTTIDYEHPIVSIDTFYRKVLNESLQWQVLDRSSRSQGNRSKIESSEYRLPPVKPTISMKQTRYITTTIQAGNRLEIDLPIPQSGGYANGQTISKREATPTKFS